MGGLFNLDTAFTTLLHAFDLDKAVFITFIMLHVCSFMRNGS